MISSKKIEEGESQIISRILQIKKILSKPIKQRMPFQTIQVCHFLSKIYLFRLLFPTSTENITTIATTATIRQTSANTYLYQQNQRNIDVTFNGITSRLGRCTTFGELQILFNLQQRLSSAVSVNDTWCIAIDKDLLIQLSERKYKIEQIYNFLERNPYFGVLDRLNKLFLSTKSQKVKFIQGSYILQIGQVPDKIMCILSGTVSVLKSITVNAKICTYQIDTLQQGSIIGQYQSINQSKSQIALYCRSGVSCFFINMNDIKNNYSYLINFFKQHYVIYPDSNEIVQLLKQQKKDQRFKQKEKKYLVPKKQRLR